MPLPKFAYRTMVITMIAITEKRVLMGAAKKRLRTETYFPVKPFKLEKSPFSDALMAARASSLIAPGLLSQAPRAGITINAIKSDAVNVINIVMGMNFIKSPVTSGQKRRGKNTARVVAVDAVIGQAIRFDASLNA